MTHLLGVPFLAYVCASDEPTIQRFLDEDGGLDERQLAVLGEVIAIAHALLKRELDLRTPATTPPLSSAETLAQLCSYSEADGEGGATAWRRKAGGEVSGFETGDSAKDALLTLARDFYPALLLPHFGDAHVGYRLGHGRLVFDHPANEHFVGALSDTEPLRQIFPPGPVESLTTSKQLMGRSGRGGGTQAGFLAALLLANAEAPAASAAGGLTVEGYLDAVCGQLEMARKLASGSEVAVVAAIGLEGVTAPEDFEFETPWGRLRTPSGWEKRLAPLNADLVIETTFPMAVEARDRGPQGELVLPDPDFFAPQREMIETVDQLRLAFVLTSGPQEPVGLRTGWRYIPDPFQYPGFSWGLQPQMPRVSKPISDLELEELDRWMGLVEERHRSTLDLATRRLLGAITERFSDEDGLVDLTIALESLLGSRSPKKIRRHLSKALNSLLGGDSSARDARHRLVSRLYDRRKDVVHGGHLEPVMARDARVEATELVVEAMRALIADRADLIDDDSRGEKLAKGQ
jgi:hypothetical protein